MLLRDSLKVQPGDHRSSHLGCPDTHLHVQTAQQGEEQQDLEQGILVGKGREMAQLCFDLSRPCRPGGENRPKNPGARSFTPSRRVPIQPSPTQSSLGRTMVFAALEWGCFRGKSCLDLLVVTMRTAHPTPRSKTLGCSLHPAEKPRQELVSHGNMK